MIKILFHYTYNITVFYAYIIYDNDDTSYFIWNNSSNNETKYLLFVKWLHKWGPVGLMLTWSCGLTSGFTTDLAQRVGVETELFLVSKRLSLSFHPRRETTLDVFFPLKKATANFDTQTVELTFLNFQNFLWSPNFIVIFYSITSKKW